MILVSVVICKLLGFLRVLLVVEVLGIIVERCLDLNLVFICFDGKGIINDC